jgi:hypothetical protein
MQGKSTLLVLLVVALLATFTMARSLQQNQNYDLDLDQKQFSLRDMANIARDKRLLPALAMMAAPHVIDWATGGSEK